MNPVCRLLGCKYPLILGAMGVICNPELVAAVSNAGGFGLLATAFAQSSDNLQKQIQETKKLTRQPFGANLFTMNPLAFEFIDILADEKIPAVTISGGSPRQVIPKLHAREIRSIVVVPTKDLALKAEASGADAIIAEGSESGGMQGFNGVSTMVLVPAIVDTVNVPVLAAGGIGDSRGYNAAMALGAQGVQVGTRFIAAKECIAHMNYKNTIVQTQETGTQLVNMEKFQIRALHTPLVENIMNGSIKPDDVFTIKSLETSWLDGQLDSGILPAGEISGLISNVLSVKEIITEMVGRS